MIEARTAITLAIVTVMPLRWDGDGDTPLSMRQAELVASVVLHALTLTGHRIVSANDATPAAAAIKPGEAA